MDHSWHDGKDPKEAPHVQESQEERQPRPYVSLSGLQEVDSKGDEEGQGPLRQ